MLPNPALFAVNGVSFAVSSVDVLFHLRKEEFFKGASEIGAIGDDAHQPDAMGKLCHHILQQRKYVLHLLSSHSMLMMYFSFYPLFPVPLDVMHEVNLDISHSEKLHLEMNGANKNGPDVIILPSKLKQFVKVKTSLFDKSKQVNKSNIDYRPCSYSQHFFFGEGYIWYY